MGHSLNLTIFSIIWGCFGVFSSHICAANWSFYGGPNRDHMLPDLQPPKFPAEPFEKVWEIEIDTGYSGVALWGDRCFTLGHRDGQDSLWCLDRRNGEVRWQYRFATESHKEYPGPRSTPAINSEAIFILTSDGQLLRLNHNGELQWHLRLKDEHSANIPGFGVGSSPCLYEDLLLVNLGGMLLCLDQSEGKLRWKEPVEKFTGSYHTPVPCKINAGDMLTFMPGEIWKYSNRDGSKKWILPWANAHRMNVANPIVTSEHILVSAWWGVGTAVFHNPPQEQPVWENKKIGAHLWDPLYRDGAIYISSGRVWNQEKNDGALLCLDMKTGAEHWRLEEAFGALVLFGDKIFSVGIGGELFVIEAKTEACAVVHRQIIGTYPSWTHPTIVPGQLLLRFANTQLASFKLPP